MKQTFGIILVLAGIVLAGYLGIWVCLVSGIISICGIVHAMMTHGTWTSGALAWAIIRIVFADAFAAIAGIAIVAAGFKLLKGKF